jgi:hypothetical protein
MNEGLTEKDFFISYNHLDTSWAQWIAWELENNGYTTAIQAWDFGAGSNFVIEMDRGLRAAKAVIAVLSPTISTLVLRRRNGQLLSEVTRGALIVS